MDRVLAFGVVARNLILEVAALLKSEAVPGLVAVTLAALCAFLAVVYLLEVRARTSAIRALRRVVEQAEDEAEFGRTIADLDAEIARIGEKSMRKHIATAWSKFLETLVEHDEDGRTILRNAVRPATFFNAEELGFGPGFWRVCPGFFVTIGLFLTFLGLISALGAMDLTTPDKVQTSLRELLAIASAKFIMSLTGLLCSILFTIVVRLGISRIDRSLHRLCGELESRLTFISLESLAVEQLRAIRDFELDQRDDGPLAAAGRPARHRPHGEHG